MFYGSTFALLVACYCATIFSMENQTETTGVYSVVVSYKNDVFGEVDMNGTRYAFIEDRKIEFLPNETRDLYIEPVVNQNLNLRIEPSTDLIKEAFTRCIGQVAEIKPTSEDTNKLLITFDNWYDNRFTGFIRYSLNKLSQYPFIVHVVDDVGIEHIYKLSPTKEDSVKEERTYLRRRI